ncbi:MAG: BlaI/MecI/CopY family transcriptional regulator [Verrucomicrobiota bacterium]|jgi:BlaI family penicillinase repressor
MKTRIRISEAEWEVMNIVWNQTPAPASDIVERLEKRKGWHARTTRTLIDRLVRKGVLRAELEGKRYLFRPKFTKQECVQKESRSFQERVFGGEPAAMLIHLVKQTDFTPEEIKELQRVLKEKAE